MKTDKKRKRSARGRWRSLFGSPRRLLWNMFRRGYVERQLAQRSGECLRCGACCQLVWKCPCFTIEGGVPSCKIYTLFRLPNCKKFPIDHRDIADRDRVYPDLPCGYSWGRKVHQRASGEKDRGGIEENRQVAAATAVEQ